jgi:hypothetical protein
MIVKAQAINKYLAKGRRYIISFNMHFILNAKIKILYLIILRQIMRNHDYSQIIMIKD